MNIFIFKMKQPKATPHSSPQCFNLNINPYIYVGGTLGRTDDSVTLRTKPAPTAADRLRKRKIAGERGGIGTGSFQSADGTNVCRVIS
jgi:hypothetical protein